MGIPGRVAPVIPGVRSCFGIGHAVSFALLDVVLKMRRFAVFRQLQVDLRLKSQIPDLTKQ
jgi:hypothetical protein